MGKDKYSMKSWSEEYKSPMTESYQPKTSEYAGMQEGKTMDYVEKRDRIQSEAAGLVKKQAYRGRYD